MKLFNATFTFFNNETNTTKQRHAIVLEVFNSRVWCAVKGVVTPALFVSNGHNFVDACRALNSGSDVFYLSRSHSHVCTTLDGMSRFDAMHLLIENNEWNISFDVASFNIEPLTPQQMAWMKLEGYALYARLLDIVDLPYHGRKSAFLRNKISRIRSDARIKLGLDMPNELRAYYKGMNLIAHDFVRARDKYAKLGHLVRAAVQFEDTDALDNWVLDNYDTYHMNRMATSFSSIKSMLDDKGIYSSLVVTDCEHIVHENGVAEVRESGRMRDWCESCRDDRAVYVEDQDEYWHQDDAIWSERHDCYYSYDIDEEEDNDDDYDDDSRSENTSHLLSYTARVTDYVQADDSFTPSPFGDFTMGIELEMATEGSMRSAIDLVRNALGVDYCVCKSDGSLPGGGFEVVTAPRKLDDHIKRFGDWFTAGIPGQFAAWDVTGHNGSGACGMHIHIDSRAFTAMTLGKFLMLINAQENVDFIRRIAGRHPSVDKQAREYCASETQDILVNPKFATKFKSPNRYRMVNTTCLRPHEAERLGLDHVGERNFNTIELRVFRSSLKRERMLAQIEFAHAAVMFCRVASYRDLDQASFIKWLRTTNNAYPNLADWYGVRRRATAKNSAPAELACADRV